MENNYMQKENYKTCYDEPTTEELFQLYKTRMSGASAAEFLIHLPEGVIRKAGSGRFRRFKVKMQKPGCCASCNRRYGGACSTGARCGCCNMSGCCDLSRQLYKKNLTEVSITKPNKETFSEEKKKGSCC